MRNRPISVRPRASGDPVVTDRRFREECLAAFGQNPPDFSKEILQQCIGVFETPRGFSFTKVRATSSPRVGTDGAGVVRSGSAVPQLHDRSLVSSAMLA